MTDTLSVNDRAENGLAVHERVAQALSAAIDDGQFRVGDRLPTHRALAQQFGVSIGSITRAIDGLSESGRVRSEVGRGTFVLEQSTHEIDTGPIDLSVNAPPALLSATQLAQANELASRKALQLAHGGYVDLAGTPAQRAIFADWLSRHRSRMHADDLVLSNGAQQGLYLAMASLAGEVTAVISEGASFPGAIAAAINLGLTPMAVPHDGDGPVPEALDRLLAKTGPAAVYLTPVCQNPLGYESGPERRQRLAEIVRRHQGWIIEDDIYGVYSAKSGPLYRDLLPDRTFYVTSFSKSLTPLVRLGVIAPPAQWLAAVRKRLRAESWGLPPYAVELSAALIETGIADAVLPTLRAEALARLRLAQRIFGLSEMPMPEGAPHFWLPMAPLQAEQIARRAGEAGIRLGAPSAMQVGSQPVEGVRICLMAPTQKTLERGLSVIAGLLSGDEEVVV